MVVEYIRYTIPATTTEAFEEAYGQAAQVLESHQHCLKCEVARGIEEPEHFVARIEWDSVEGRGQGFRSSPHFREFFSAVQPLLSQIQGMKHYAIGRTGGGAQR